MHRYVPDKPYSLNGFLNMLLFVLKLFMVIQKLPFATAAKTAIHTIRRDPEWRRLNQCVDTGFRILLLSLYDAGNNQIQRHRPVNKNSKAVQPCKAFASKGYPGNFKFDKLSFFNFYFN